MKKIFGILLCTFHFSLCTLSAQDYYRHPVTPPENYRQNNHFKDSLQRKSFFFAFNAGLSVPLRSFGSKDTAADFMIPTNSDSTHAKGFATVGFHIDAKAGYFLFPQFGLLAKISYNYNSFDANTLNNIINGYYYYTVNGGYSIWQFMGGVFGNFQVSPVSSLWIEGMIGDIHANFPSFSVSDGYVTLTGRLADANNLAGSLSIGIDYTINDNVSFIGSLSYSGATLSYPTSYYTGSGKGYVTSSYTQIHAITMPYGNLDLSIGLIFKL